MIKKFDIPITSEDRCEVEIEVERGQVVSFLVRYDAFIDGRWCNVAVFDNHGGSAHWHLVDPFSGKGDKRPIALDLKGAVDYAIGTAKSRWREWRGWFERRLRDGQQNLFQ